LDEERKQQEEARTFALESSRRIAQEEKRLATAARLNLQQAVLDRKRALLTRPHELTPINSNQLFSKGPGLGRSEDLQITPMVQGEEPEARV
jgi:hypothetical protein